MKVEELRIGNLILDDFNEVHKVECIKSDMYVSMDMDGEEQVIFSKSIDSGLYVCDKISGIPLTEELLLKLGFTKGERYWSFNGFDVDSKGWIGFNNMVADCKIKHVHQLQNLYFALTGEELVIKDVL